MHGIVNKVTKQMWDTDESVVEMIFETEANKKGLKLSDAKRQIDYQLFIPSEDENEPGITIPSNEVDANLVQIMYRWDD
jgi:hypothetical protein